MQDPKMAMMAQQLQAAPPAQAMPQQPMPGADGAPQMGGAMDPMQAQELLAQHGITPDNAEMVIMALQTVMGGQG